MSLAAVEGSLEAMGAYLDVGIEVFSRDEEVDNSLVVVGYGPMNG